MNSRVIAEGPAVVSFNGYQYYSEGTITLKPELKLREITSSYFGPVDARVTDKTFTLSFTPVGMLDTVAAYFPFAATDIGKLVAPASDTPIYIYTSAGEKITIPAGCFAKCPQLMLGTDKGPMGDMALAGMGNITAVDAAADTHYKIETAAIAAHSLNPDKATTPAYKAVIGTGETVVELDSETGFVFDLGATFAARAVNRYGTVNYKLTGLKPSVSFTPFGLTEAQAIALLNIQGTNAAKLGASNKRGLQLQILPADSSAKGVTVTFADFQCREGSMLFGAEDPRHGQYVFVPAVKVTTGVPGVLYTVAFPSWA
jgi:hypothetical protein